MTTTETLIAGNIYDVTTLEHVGWTGGDGTGHDGYSAGDYFDPHGRYLGPDAHGIEPTFSAQEYRIALVNNDGSWDVIDTFDALNDAAANAYAEEHHADVEWYVIDAEGRNINAW